MRGGKSFLLAGLLIAITSGIFFWSSGQSSDPVLAASTASISGTVKDDGGKPLRGEPRVWVTSLDTFAKVLTEKNMLLLEMIRNAQPQSLTELARMSDRALPNLSRTLHTMERLGIVEFLEKPNGRKVPTVLCTKVKLEVDFHADKAA